MGAHVGDPGEEAVGGVAEGGVDPRLGDGAFGGEVLVGGGEADGAPQSLAVDHGGLQRVGTAQKPLGGLHVPVLQALADAGGADGQPVHLHLGLDAHTVLAEGLQQMVDGARGVTAEVVVEAADRPHTAAGLLEEGDELGGGVVADVGKIAEADEIHPHTGKETELVPQGGQMPADTDRGDSLGGENVVHRRADEAEDTRQGLSLGGRQLTGELLALVEQDRMGAVNAVEVTEAEHRAGGRLHETGLRTPQVGKDQTGGHGSGVLTGGGAVADVEVDEGGEELVPTDAAGDGAGVGALGKVGGILGDEVARQLGGGILSAGADDGDELGQGILTAGAGSILPPGGSRRSFGGIQIQEFVGIRHGKTVSFHGGSRELIQTTMNCI